MSEHIEGFAINGRNCFLLVFLLIVLEMSTFLKVSEMDYTSLYMSPLYFALQFPVFFYILVGLVSLILLSTSNKSMYSFLVIASASLYFSKNLAHHLALRTLLFSDSYSQYASGWALKDGISWGPYSHWPGFPLALLTLESVTGLGPFQITLLSLLTFRALEFVGILTFTKRFLGREASILSTLFLTVSEPQWYHLNAASFSFSILLLSFVMFLYYLLSSNSLHFFVSLFLSLALIIYHGVWPLFLSIAMIVSLIGLWLIRHIDKSITSQVGVRRTAWQLAFPIVVAWCSWYMYNYYVHFSGLISQQLKFFEIPSSRLLPGNEWDFNIMSIVTKIVAYSPLFIALPLLFSCIRALFRHRMKRFHIVALILFALTFVIGMMNVVIPLVIGMMNVVIPFGYEWRGIILYSLFFPTLCGLSLVKTRMNNRALHKTMCALTLVTMILSFFSWNFSGHFSVAGITTHDEAAAIFIGEHLATPASLTGDTRYIDVSEFFTCPKMLYSIRQDIWAAKDLKRAILANESLTSSLVAINRMTPAYFAAYGVTADQVLAFVPTLCANRNLDLIYENNYSTVWWNR